MLVFPTRPVNTGRVRTPLHTTLIHGPSLWAVNTGVNFDTRPWTRPVCTARVRGTCLRTVFTGVKKTSKTSSMNTVREHAYHFRHPWIRVVWTGNRLHGPCSRVSTRKSSGDEIANVNCLYDDIVHVLQNTIDSCIPPQIDAAVMCGTHVYQIQWSNAM